MTKRFIPEQVIEQKIFVMRGQKVIIDRDIAQLYGVATKYLNRQVRRNIKRFPDEFMFRLNAAEKDGLVTICHRLEPLKHSSVLPYAFTEHGVAMLASVLNSDRAIKISIDIIKTFIKLREMLYANNELAVQLQKLERKLEKHDQEIILIFDTIQKLIKLPEEKPKKGIGFHVKYD